MDTIIIGLTVLNVLTAAACWAFWDMIVRDAAKYRADVNRMIEAMEKFNEDAS